MLSVSARALSQEGYVHIVLLDYGPKQFEFSFSRHHQRRGLEVKQNIIMSKCRVTLTTDSN
jgi:hypothetical protein